MRKKTLLIVGGHLTPALAVIEQIRRATDWNISWVGRKFAMEGVKTASLEYKIIPELGIPFYTLYTGRFQRRWTRWTAPSLLRIPIGFFHALVLLLKLKPRVILSFGGYLSPPVVIAGWVLSIPSVIHEQTAASGLANRTVSPFAAAIALSYHTSAPEFPHEKTVLTGNPVRREILEIKRRPTKPPLLFITGGNQGSQTINRAVARILARLVNRYRVIHQTGTLDYRKFAAKQTRFPGRYRVYANLAPSEIPNVLARASLVVGRAGANTVAEVAAVGVPAIFIPIPWSERGEQVKNAQLLSSAGLARVILQEQLTPEFLLSTIEEMVRTPPSRNAVRAAKKLVQKDAVEKLVDLVKKYME